MILEKAPEALASFAPLAGILLFAIPSYYGVIKQRKALGVVILIVLGAFSLLAETILIKSGLPYAGFSYNEVLGPKLLEATPWIMAFAYPPILLTAFWFASKFTRGFARVIIAAILASAIHIVMDPAITTLEFWQWEAAGGFYGVPWIEVVGWLVGGFIGTTLLHLMWGKEQRVKAPVAYSGFALLLFWTGVNAGLTQKIPLGVGAIYGLIILGVIILEKQQFKEEK